VTARRAGLQLFAYSFIALFLELMIIRWAPSVVRLVAYYANLLLISSFLGLGIGAMIAKRRASLFAFTPLLLALSVAVILLARNLSIPASGTEHRFYAAGGALTGYLGLAAIFATNAAVFVPIGQRIGELFDALPPLAAYGWDLGGSLAGTLVFGLFSFTQFSPVVGMGGVALALIALTPQRRLTLTVLPLMAAVAGTWFSNDRNAIWSPYYYITVREYSPDIRTAGERSRALAEPRAGVKSMQNPPTYFVSVNHDFYQPHQTLDPARYSPERQLDLRRGRAGYDLPYLLSAGHNRVLVLGAGGGTDAEVALLNGAAQVDAVEIDPVLVEISRRFNPSAVYDDPRVRVHVDDARAFVRRATERYDMVVFGWLDSQALFSAMSNLRLDGYIYTVESMRAAYGLLNEQGSLSLSFFAQYDWLADKLVRMVREGTGREPAVYRRGGQVVLHVSKGAPASSPAEHGGFVRVAAPAAVNAASEPPRDDWPFLYLAGKHIPADYAIVIAVLLAISLPAVRVVRGAGFGAADLHFAFLGAGFLLLETKSIGDISLYFGATWLVTTIVIAGVLLMVLLANLVASRMAQARRWLFAPLFASLVMLALVDRESVLALDVPARLAWCLLVVPLPIFFAGLIFSSSFRQASSASRVLGANLVGAMVGGFSEYLGMATGTSALVWIALGAYGLALMMSERRPYTVTAGPSLP
jgi:hypothetical protein